MYVYICMGMHVLFERNRLFVRRSSLQVTHALDNLLHSWATRMSVNIIMCGQSYCIGFHTGVNVNANIMRYEWI